MLMLSIDAQISRKQFMRQRPMKRLLITTSLNAQNALENKVFVIKDVSSEMEKKKKGVVQ